ncbi:TatD family hydrolase [Methylobacterium sp. J-078]|uniref:Qat anti-phage system TatD family nuclease QatD n=1 Tax=Methylobacterium sp. J-078 TaxID=2836657 RepID=UPI001FB9D55E|nr:Qat anti-phage system TatD family nuclease QatD [Methylobacterium sp. J-078]MCJ2046368.1 TatD family hydrolase [Methylobacterium sp. J-078]
MIDLHCHIDLYPNPRAVLDAAEDKGVFVLAVTTTPLAFQGNLDLVEGRRRVRVALGLHPELVAERHGEIDHFVELLPNTAYVGEVGLDGSPRNRASFARQELVFARIVEACADLGGRVLSIHSRRAAGAVLDILAGTPTCGVPVLHWFSGSMKELERAATAGCWFSVGPLMLTTPAGRRLAAAMPRNRVLTETDAPFAQISGQPLMPWDVAAAENALAELWQLPAMEAHRQLRDNLRSLATRASEMATRPRVLSRPGEIPTYAG